MLALSGSFVFAPSASGAVALSTFAAGLSLAGSAAGFMGSGRSARAEALAEEAKIILLEGLTEDMAAVIQAQEYILEHIADMENVFRRVIADVRIEQGRLVVLSRHRRFLLEQKAMLENDGGRADDRRAVEKYWSNRERDLEEVRRIADIIHFTVGAQSDPASVTLRAICLRVEVDLICELMAMGSLSAFVSDEIAEVRDWFAEVLDEEAPNGLFAQMRKAQVSLEQKEEALLTGLAFDEARGHGFLQGATVNYNGIRAGVLEQIRLDDPPLNSQSVQYGPLAAPIYLRVDVVRAIATPSYLSFELVTQDAPAFTTRSYTNLHEYHEDWGPGDLLGLGQDFEPPSLDMAEITDTIGDHTLLGTRLSELEETVAVARMALELCTWVVNTGKGV